MSTERPGGERPVDEAVDQAWRDASTEGPSPRIDAAILAAARADISRKPATEAAPSARARRDWWTRWQPLAAAAAVAGLAFVLVQTIPRDRDVTPSIAVEMSRQRAPVVAPAAEPSAPTAKIAPPAEATRSAELPQVGETPPATKSSEAAVLPPAGSAVATETEAAASSGAASNAADRSAVAAEADAAAGTRYRAAAPAPSPAAVPAPPLAPAEWAARIESLHDAGDLAGAAAELQAFRAEYQDADRHLPDALREWAASVK